MIALALACNPKVLLADEPTTALDVTVQRAILDLLQDLRDARGLGVLFVTHDLDVVKDIADHVVVMRHGSVVESGPCDEVMHTPSHPYTQELLAAMPEPLAGQRGDAEGEGGNVPLIEARNVVKRYVTKEPLGQTPRPLHRAQRRQHGHRSRGACGAGGRKRIREIDPRTGHAWA